MPPQDDGAPANAGCQTGSEMGCLENWAYQGVITEEEYNRKRADIIADV